jgi:perosamine synthetase
MNRKSRSDDFVPVSQPFFWGDECDCVLEAIEGGWISSRGEFIDRFESEFASFVGTRHAVGVCNGTCALQLAIAALGIGAGDEVIVPDFTMMAPVFAVIHAGAKPVPIDADDTWNIDVEKIELRITEKTRAILAVHIYGHPTNMEVLLEIARKHRLHIIEDGAEAHGATSHGRNVGAIGTLGAFSFYANKIITTGEGGMVVTDDDSLANSVRALRNMNFGEGVESRFRHRGLGFNFRLSNLHAAIGFAQIKHAAEAIADRHRIATEYRRELETIDGLTLPPMTGWAGPVNWVYGIVVQPSFGLSRQALQQRLSDAGIETRRFFTPLHEQPFYSECNSIEYPMASMLGQHGLYLPTFVGLKTDVIQRIASTIRCAQHKDGRSAI